VGGNEADFIAAATNPMDDGQNVDPEPEPFGCFKQTGTQQAAAPPLALWLALAALGGVAAARRRR
jgi:MYXO-CTERM domain-containing protein